VFAEVRCAQIHPRQRHERAAMKKLRRWRCPAIFGFCCRAADDV